MTDSIDTPSAPAAATAPTISLRLLNAPAVVLPGGSARALERRAAALLALVALEPGTTRARAATLLWPDSDNPRQALRQQLLRFRRNVGMELLEGEEVLQLSAAVAADVLRPADAAPGVLLGDLEFDDCEQFAQWLALQREQRRGGTATRIQQQLAEAEAAGDLDAALSLATQLLHADYDSEVHHRTVMRLHYLRGDIAQAQATYQRLRAHLHTRYGALPSSDTEQLARATQLALAATPATRAVAPQVPVTVLRPPQLIGRRAEIAQIEGAWRNARSVLVLGEPGLGKSRLLAELVRPWRCINVQGRPGDVGVPYATLMRALRSTLERCEVTLSPAQRLDLARLLPELAPGATLPAEAPGLALRHAVEALLLGARMGGAALQVLIIDDLHFADDASVEMLQGVISSLHEQLHFALAQRPGEGSAAAAALRAALEEARIMDPLVLAPLQEAEVEALVASLQIADLDAQALAAPLTRHTGGNPLYALETIKQGLATGQLRAGRLPQPDTVGTLIERRLKQLPDKAIALARVAAIAGPDFCIPLAEHALGERALALTDVWNSLQDAQVLRDTGFAHDLVADAVLRSVPAPIARHLHGEVARWLEQSEGEPARMAAHWLKAGDELRALPQLHRAAARALQALRPREGVAFLEQALEIETKHGRRESAFETLDRIIDERHRLDLDRSMLPQIERLRDLAGTPQQRVRALLTRADYAMHRCEQLELGRQAAAQALEIACQVGMDRGRIEALGSLGVLDTMLNHFESALEHVDQLLPLARALPAGEVRCDLLTRAAYVMARTERAPQGADLLDEAAQESIDLPHLRLVVLANAAHARLQLNQPHEALQRLDLSDALRASFDAAKGAGHSNAWMRAKACRLVGRYGEALQLLEVAIDEIGAVSPGKLASALVDRAFVWLDLGQTARALQDFARSNSVEADPIGDVSRFHLGLRMHNLKLAPAPAPCGMPLAAFARVSIALEQSATLEPAAALDALAAAREDARRCAYRGLEASALARAAQRHLALGAVEHAAQCAREAVALAEGHSTHDLSWPDIVLCAAPALAQAGHVEESARLLADGSRWLMRVRDALPGAYQSSYLTVNATARQLLTLSTQTKRS